MGNDMNAITIRNASKLYSGKRGRKIEALTGLSLQIHAGEVFGFLGPNGAGKSTTIKSIMGLVPLTSGNIDIHGVPVSQIAARRNVGYLPENPAFYDFLTAREYLNFVGKVFAMSEATAEKRINETLSLLQLTEAADRPIRGYSKGMVQRLGLAQALIHDPDLYILDEPMSGLDPLGRALVKDIIKSLRERDKTVFFSTHITADVEMVCDRVGVIVNGKLRAVDRVSAILEQGEVGYRIHTTSKTGEAGEVNIEKQQLAEFISKCSEEGVTVVRVEPRRKDLEAFFLETVAREADESLQTS
ncbi:ABC transporter ATP-binding protein [Geotalea sp. SG265]|uniref:ABC transporter ATP-binding protein n=1 Tax=Geotalea sp. SG265 TaxID=2922867 RepID=UPI00325FB8B0